MLIILVKKPGICNPYQGYTCLGTLLDVYINATICLCNILYFVLENTKADNY